MSIKGFENGVHRMDLPSATRKQGASGGADAMWLNDSLAPQRRLEHDTSTYPELKSILKSSVRPEEYVGPWHPLWPIVERVSAQIWRELFQEKGPHRKVPVQEAAQVELVKQRFLDVMSEDSALARRIFTVAEGEQVLHNVIHEVLGYGPLTRLLADGSITCIMVVSSQLVYIERSDETQEVRNCFADRAHLDRIVENILRHAERRRETRWPVIDAHLPDGSFVNIVMPPGAVKGPTVTIHKFPRKLLSLADLVQLGSLTQEMGDFLYACVESRLNIVICGGRRSGRTTLLNALAAHIPESERIITVEEIVELQLRQKHVVTLEARLVEQESKGDVTLSDLVTNALYMRPERILVGECRGEETVELLSAMHGGHNGSMTTVYAQDLRDCIQRLEAAWLMRDPKQPPSTIQGWIAQAIDVGIHLGYLSDGSRKVLNVAEVQGIEGGRIKFRSIFHYQDTGIDSRTGRIVGDFEPEGFRSSLVEKLEAHYIHVPQDMFVPRRLSGR